MDYKQRAKELREEVRLLVSGIQMRKGKSICSDTVYSVAKGLLSPVIIIRTPAGKTREQATVEAWESRLKVAKKIAQVKG